MPPYITLNDQLAYNSRILPPRASKKRKTPKTDTINIDFPHIVAHSTRNKGPSGPMEARQA